MKKLLIRSVVFLVCFFALTSSSHACYFFFNYPKLETTLGTTGTLVVRVLLDHSDCSLEGGIEGMQFAWQNVQVIASTDWKEVDKDLYERAFSLTLSEEGTGFFKIYKDCTREGYEEAVVPIVVLPGGSTWQKASEGIYPYTDNKNPSVVTGPFTVLEQELVQDDVSIAVLHMPGLVENASGEMVVFYVEHDREKQAVLIVGPNFYYRF